MLQVLCPGQDYNKYGFIFNPGSKYISGNIFSLCVKSAAFLVEGKRYWEGDRISEITTNTLCFSYLQEEISQSALPKCLLYSHYFITAQPDYSEVLLTSVSACLKTNACLFWSPGASRLRPSCSVSSSALESLALFTLPYHRHATFQLVNLFHWFDSQKTHFLVLSSEHETRQQLSFCRSPKPPPEHICSRAAPQVSASQCLPSPGSPGFPPLLFRLCWCWLLPTSATGGHSPHCLAYVAILAYAGFFFSASADFVLA